MLRVRELTVEIEGSVILDRTSLEVADGEVLAVLGPSGSGKTTLLRAIAGLQRAQSGTICWDEADLATVAVEHRGFGLMFQDFALFPHRTVEGNVAFGLRMQDHRREEIRARVSEVLDWVGLPEYEGRSISGLSGGEQQRVALARALAPAPRLLMLDEPLGSLDRALRERLIVELRGLLVDHQITAVYVTHDQEEAFTIADRLLVLRSGSVAQTGTPEEVYRKPADEWTARFLGFRNIVRCEIVAGTADCGWSRLDAKGYANGPATLVIPPDSVSLDPQSSVAGRVESRSFRGGHYLLQVQVDGGPLLDVEAADPVPEPGATVGLRVDGAVVISS